MGKLERKMRKKAGKSLRINYGRKTKRGKKRENKNEFVRKLKEKFLHIFGFVYIENGKNIVQLYSLL